MTNDRQPVDVWKSFNTSGVTSEAERLITEGEIPSMRVISLLSEESGSVHMLTKAICEEGSVWESSDRRRLSMRDWASVVLQKFTTTYLSLRASKLSMEDLRVRVSDGASLPISSAWLPTGIDEERNAANTNDKNKYLVFTIIFFCFKIVSRHQSRCLSRKTLPITGGIRLKNCRKNGSRWR